MAVTVYRSLVADLEVFEYVMTTPAGKTYKMMLPAGWHKPINPYTLAKSGPTQRRWVARLTAGTAPWPRPVAEEFAQAHGELREWLYMQAEEQQHGRA